MEFTCPKEVLEKGVATISRAVAAKGPLPILSNILISADVASITLTATDLEVGMQVTVDAQVLKSGSLTVAGRRLSEILSKLPKADLEVVGGDQMTLRCARSRFALPVMPADEFPKVPVPSYKDPGKVVSVESKVLVKALKLVDFAADKDEKKPTGGVLVKVADRMLEIAATDGYRLARYRSPVDSDGSFQALVPLRAAKELERLIGNDEENTFLTIEGGFVLFSVGDRHMSSRIVQGQFPPVEQIIPRSWATNMLVDRISLRACIERVAVMASEREAKRIALKIDQGEVQVAANAADLGESTDAVECEIQGEGLEIAFNAAYLLDGLKALDSTTVKLSFNGPLSPAFVEPVDDETHFYLLMPIRN